MELYSNRLKYSGKRNADIRFMVDVLLLFRPGIIRTPGIYYPVNNTVMFKSYFKIGWRNLVKNKVFSLINISGLSLGLTCSILIALWVVDEYAIDAFHEDGDRILSPVANMQVARSPMEVMILPDYWVTR